VNFIFFGLFESAQAVKILPAAMAPSFVIVGPQSLALRVSSSASAALASLMDRKSLSVSHIRKFLISDISDNMSYIADRISCRCGGFAQGVIR
jgi:hypothetical protein